MMRSFYVVYVCSIRVNKRVYTCSEHSVRIRIGRKNAALEINPQTVRRDCCLLICIARLLYDYESLSHRVNRQCMSTCEYIYTTESIIFHTCNTNQAQHNNNMTSPTKQTSQVLLK